MRAKIAKRAVDQLEPGQSLADTEIRGFIARRLPSGAITYGYRFRNRQGEQRWLALGTHGNITPDEARALAKKRAGEVADDRDPMAEREVARSQETNTVNHVLDAFVERHLATKRTGEHVAKALDRCVRPRIGGKSIYALTRRDIAELLDKIETDNGAVMADRTLAYL